VADLVLGSISTLRRLPGKTVVLLGLFSHYDRVSEEQNLML
jgi:hypothetical protein